jgi:hypothetical protein
MSYAKFSTAIAIALCASLAIAADASAQHRSRSGGGGAVVGRAVPRGSYGSRVVVPRYYSSRVIVPRVVGVIPYRPYYYPYRPGLTIGFYAGNVYPYGYGYYGYPYGYSAGYGYGYGSGYGYGYGYPGYALPPSTYMTTVPGYAYGGVRIQGAPRDAQVFADGYYVGIVGDFDGALQHLNLTAGPHQIEIRAPGLPPVQFEVNVIPGQTITYHAGPY